MLDFYESSSLVLVDAGASVDLLILIFRLIERRSLPPIGDINKGILNVFGCGLGFRSAEVCLDYLNLDPYYRCQSKNVKTDFECELSQFLEKIQADYGCEVEVQRLSLGSEADCVARNEGDKEAAGPNYAGVVQEQSHHAHERYNFDHWEFEF